MEMPYGVLTKNDCSMVCWLLRTLYGLKQAGNEWYKEMSMVFKLMGFKVSLCDSSLFIRFNNQGGCKGNQRQTPNSKLRSYFMTTRRSYICSPHCTFMAIVLIVYSSVE
jgi:hypothetical protein